MNNPNGSNHRKRGRKKSNYAASWGETINGLARRPSDGRWRVIGSDITFTEPDERKAVAHFYALTSTKKPLTPHEQEAVELDDWLQEQLDNAGDNYFAAVNRGFVWEASQGVDSAKNRMMRWVGEQVRLEPKLWAAGTGIEQIAYFRNIKPLVVPTFDELQSVWKTHFKKSKEQKRRVLRAWEDFTKTSGVNEVEDITPEVAIAYRDNVYARNVTPKMQMNIFTRVRRLLTFAKSRAITGLNDAIDALKLLVPSDSTVSLDPKPISPEDWVKLFNAATGDNKAMVLLMLNGAFYLQEVVRLKWSEIKDGAIITHRQKEGRCVRVCVLWQETLDALAAVARKGDHIFYSYQGAPLGVKGAEKRFRELRENAKVAVTSSQLRDGAATAAAGANVNQQIQNVLLGHRSGISDHYVKRNTAMVQPAVDAVRACYFSK
jgi:integrase